MVLSLKKNKLASLLKWYKKYGKNYIIYFENVSHMAIILYE